MKILLVQPAKAPDTIGCEDIFLYEPLALEYLAAPLVEEHDVKIVDLRLDNNLRKFFIEFNPDIVGITAYTVHVNIVKEMFKLMKLWNPRVFTVVGGHHATVAYQDFLESYINLIVMGEGVLVFKEVVSRFEKNLPFDGLAGTAYFKNGETAITPQTIVTDLDSLPFPVRYLTNEYRHRYFSEWNKPLATIRTSQGCPFRCSFCALWKLNGGRYLKRKPEKIVEELSGIKEKYIFFADDESLIDTQRISKLAKLIKESGIKKKYFIYGRSDTIESHPEVIEQWKKIGLERIFIGLEFFRDKDMEEVRKKSTIRVNEEAIRILQNLDIRIFGSFIIKPDFTREDFREFKSYCRRLRLHLPVFSVLTPLPGTDYYEEVKDKLITNNFDYFDLLHSILKTRLPLKEFYEEFYQLYRNSTSTLNRIKLLLEYSPREIMKVIKMSNRIRNGYISLESL
jgi:hopanoid C-3 methylase